MTAAAPLPVAYIIGPAVPHARARRCLLAYCAQPRAGAGIHAEHEARLSDVHEQVNKLHLEGAATHTRWRKVVHAAALLRWSDTWRLAARPPRSRRPAHALARLCMRNSGNKDYVRECGGIAALVGLLAPSGSAAVHEQAAAALANLCWDNVKNKDSVRECGAVYALLGLLAPGNPDAVQRTAAMALANLCADCGQNKDSVRECGGEPALIALLAPGHSTAVHEHAASALRALCRSNPRRGSASGSAEVSQRWSVCWRLGTLLLCRGPLQRRSQTSAARIPRTRTASGSAGECPR